MKPRKPRARTTSKPASGRRPPGWVPYFLRALERSGDVRAAAADAGVDFTTAYARRKAHAEFAAAWSAALAAHAEAKRRDEEEEGFWVPLPAPPDTPPPPSADPLPTGCAGREELVQVAGQLRRAGYGRWSKARERVFLAELGASGNFARAARAAAISTQAVQRRCQKERRLAQACAIAVASAKARLHANLVAAGNQSFDPADLPDPEDSPLPPVSVREAIDILRLKGTGAAVPDDRLAEPDEEDGQDGEWEQARDNILGRLERLREQQRERKQEAGWAYDEAHEEWVPPGWGRPEQMAIAAGAPRATASKHCPHCGGGLRLALEGPGEPPAG